MVNAREDGTAVYMIQRDGRIDREREELEPRSLRFVRRLVTDIDPSKDGGPFEPPDIDAFLDA